MIRTRNLLSLICCISCCVSYTAEADMTNIDEKYRLSFEETSRVIGKINRCCYQFEPRTSAVGLLAEQNYKFELFDGNTLYLIIEDFGAHTFWYRLFIQDASGKIRLIELDVPPNSDLSWYYYVDGTRIFNPSFDPISYELVAWDFGRAGDLLLRLTYNYDGKLGQEFILKSLEEDNKRDGNSEYNRKKTYR